MLEQISFISAVSSDIEVVLEVKQTYYICHLCNSFLPHMLTSAYLQTQKGSYLTSSTETLN